MFVPRSTTGSQNEPEELEMFTFRFSFPAALGLGDKLDRGDGPGEMGNALPTVKLFSDRDHR